MRITKQDLQAEVNRLNIDSGLDFTLEHANGGYKLEVRNASIVVTPRCSAHEMEIALQTLHNIFKLRQSE